MRKKPKTEDGDEGEERASIVEKRKNPDELHDELIKVLKERASILEKRKNPDELHDELIKVLEESIDAREKELEGASEILLAWALEQGLSENPKRNPKRNPKLIPKLYAEARRRWAHLTTRHGISKILLATLEKL